MAKDKFHGAVRRALEKENWQITHDPFPFDYGGVNFQIDIGAEQVLGAERAGEKIAVEIKSFLNPSAITDFYQALGQFLSYRLALAHFEPARMLYLAVPDDTYRTFFQLPFTQGAVQAYQLQIIVYNPEQERIEEWNP